MLLDRQRVKFWQKWVFGLMALVMGGFLVMIPLSNNLGCSGSSSVTKQLDTEITKSQAVVKADPKSVAAWRILGDNYLARANQPTAQAAAQQTDWSAAAASYERAVKLLLKKKGKASRTEELATLNQLVSVYLFLKDYQMATGAYGRITALRPRDAQSFFDMATTAISAGDTNTALLAFGKFLELAPRSPDAATVREWIKKNTPKASPSPSPTKGTGP